MASARSWRPRVDGVLALIAVAGCRMHCVVTVNFRTLAIV